MPRSSTSPAPLKRHLQAGFTLIELMIVVAILAVLAGIAVYAFGSEAKRAKVDAEVNPFFAEFHLRQQAYKTETGRYFDGLTEADTYPSSPTPSKQNLGTWPTEWDTLRFAPPELQAMCGYTTVAGLGGDATNVGGIASGDFAYTPPAVHWYYILAHCNQDGDTGTDSYYFSSSTDPSIRKLNPGM